MDTENVKRKISLAITTYNRVDLTIKSFQGVLEDSRVSEILIIDDCSDENFFNSLQEAINTISAAHKKVKLKRNVENLGMSKNKAHAIRKCKEDWVIILDSDNVIDSTYIDKIFEIQLWHPDTIYMPDFAFPDFNYTKYSGFSFDKNNMDIYIKDPEFQCCLNTCNYFVNKVNYVKTYNYNPQIKESDTIWFLYLWLEKGFGFTIVKDMRYKHLVHQHSGWLQNAEYNQRKGEEIINLILHLKLES